MPGTSIHAEPSIRAWRPPVAGVVEVLHARFPSHAYPMHAHDAWTLLLVDDGAVRYDLDRHERGAFGDVVTLLPPKVPHNGTGANGHGFRKRVLYLSPEQLPERLIGASVDAPALIDPGLHRMISSVHRLLRSPGDSPMATELLAVSLERLRVRLAAHPVPPPDASAARTLRDLLEAHLVPGISLADASSRLHFAPAHLVRSFRREYGMTPHQYVISRRVDLARRLIVSGHPLPSVALRSGFYDQPHLIRHFKRILGTTPRTFQSPASVRP